MEKKEKDSNQAEESRDEELDIANSVTKAQNVLKKIIGNLSAHQFKLEQIKKNGSSTRYIIISSVVPDLGEERDYYFIKVDVDTGKVVPPMGKGKMVDGQFEFQEIEIKSGWEE